MSVEVEKRGPITVVTIDRPDARNAVDRDTAQKLADVRWLRLSFRQMLLREGR